MWHTLLKFNTPSDGDIPTIASITDKLGITDWLEKQSVRPYLSRSYKPDNITENLLEIEVDDNLWQKYQAR